MNKLTIIFSATLFLVGLMICPTFSFAQTENKPKQSEPSYEVVLQILIASNNQIAKTNIPQSLSNVIKKLKANYSFSDYRLATTFLERVSESVEHKGIFSDFVQNQSVTAPVFSEWTLNGLESLPNSKGQNTIQFQNFRFGARIPIVTTKIENGTSFPVINYEQIGLSMRKLNLSPDTPTVIGSLSTSKADELMFLVLSVKSTEE